MMRGSIENTSWSTRGGGVSDYGERAGSFDNFNKGMGMGSMGQSRGSSVGAISLNSANSVGVVRNPDPITMVMPSTPQSAVSDRCVR